MKLIFDFDDFDDLVHEDGHFEFIINYLRGLDASIFVLEENYIDKDFMIDFSKYHSRSFGHKVSETKRCHFFAHIDKEQFYDYFNSNDAGLQDHYLGFIVLKPISPPRTEPICDRDPSTDNPVRYTIGRTVLKTYDEYEGDHRVRNYIKYPNECNLFGYDLRIESLPFQGKDYIVGMCATSALWSTMCCLSHYYDTQHYSMYEITKESVSLVEPEIRSFPNDGLTVGQTAHFLNTQGIVVECFSIHDDDSDFVQDLIKAYLPANIPMIATLRCDDPDSGYGHHAVVVSGYSLDEGRNIKKLYLHDDNVCPYARVGSDDGFITWRYLDNKYNHDFKLSFITVPLYHKIRTPFLLMRNCRDSVQKIRNHDRERELDFNLLLTTVNEYKRELREKRFYSKEKILIEQFPKYLWVVRGYSNRGYACMDSIYDATSPNDDLIGYIEYEGP